MSVEDRGQADFCRGLLGTPMTAQESINTAEVWISAPDVLTSVFSWFSWYTVLVFVYLSRTKNFLRRLSSKLGSQRQLHVKKP